MFLKLAKELGQIKTGQEDYKVDYFSKKAAKDYIYGKIPLNESIQKIASENNLGDEFVKRVCEQANHVVSSHMFESNQDKNFEFPLADWDQIIGPTEKVAESIYDKSPSFHKEARLHHLFMPEYLRDDPKNFFYKKPREEKELQKEAIIGPLADLMTLGIPSIVRHGTGHSDGQKAFNEGKKLEGNEGRSLGKLLLVPGQLGYSMGFPKGHGEAYLDKHHDKFVANDPILDPYFDEHTSDKIKNEYKQNKAIYQPERKEHILNQLTSRGSWERHTDDEDDWDDERYRHRRRYEKLAELFPPTLKLKSDPYQSVMDLKETLQRSEQIIDHEVFSNERRQNELYPTLYNEFRNELGDSSYYKVAQAIIPFLRNQEIIEKLTYDLLDDSIITEEDFFRVEKLAEAPNKDAKIIKLAQVYEDLLEDYSILLSAQKEIKEQTQRVCDFLNKR